MQDVRLQVIQIRAELRKRKMFKVSVERVVNVQGMFTTSVVKIDPKVFKLSSCLTQLSTEFQLLIKLKKLKSYFHTLKLSDAVFILLINDKMPTIVGKILSRINFMLSRVEHEASFIPLRPCL